MPNPTLGTYKRINFLLRPDYYEKLVELAGGADNVNWFCKERLREYIKWRHRDKRTPEQKAKVHPRHPRSEEIDKILENL